MKIHYLQHVPFEGLGNIEKWAIANHHSISSTKLYANDALPLMEDLDFLIIMGGPMNIYEEDKYPWLTTEKKLIEQAIQQNKIVLGICLGSQLIADVLGAKVYKGNYPEIGWFPVTQTEEAKKSDIFSLLPEKFPVFHWHGDTFELPNNATHLAYSEACQNQAFSYGKKVVALQCHLESTPDNLQQMIKHCSDEFVEGKYIQKPEEILSKNNNFTIINAAMNNLMNQMTNQY